ncbi:hypothetical protein H6F74_28325 [Trichocoleus sp. FACHB-90]|nr:hypothetical protein [Trichocoleus sp. FACHB-90]MBD1930098.1 hypothetical protein [Trichocoleus sp. FACHB-90]
MIARYLKKTDKSNVKGAIAFNPVYGSSATRTRTILGKTQKCLPMPTT